MSDMYTTIAQRAARALDQGQTVTLNIRLNQNATIEDIAATLWVASHSPAVRYIDVDSDDGAVKAELETGTEPPPA